MEPYKTLSKEEARPLSRDPPLRSTFASFISMGEWQNDVKKTLVPKAAGTSTRPHHSLPSSGDFNNCCRIGQSREETKACQVSSKHLQGTISSDQNGLHVQP